MLSKEEFLEFERTTEINGENETNTSCREKMLQNTNQETITHNKTHTLCTRNSKTESINVINSKTQKKPIPQTRINNKQGHSECATVPEGLKHPGFMLMSALVIWKFSLVY